MMTTIILYSLIILSILSTAFQFKKSREYKHDERGQFILAKAGSFSIIGVALAYILVAVVQSLVHQFSSPTEWFYIAITFMYVSSVCANTIGIIYCERKY
ncbi:hypothetical protein [Bacillus safensis]|uniref:hypothetical protein n=1 Tax=Bacillus safensis TaxID=561879 RepID=UPI00201E729B|nr:hypothetical protein [Bacillus safensis]UQZ91605.1 hypothetical protein EI692_00880 [Bacillus safensis]WAT81025.1 hypothetical protein O0R49_01210 [Bacillus safensis]